MISNNFLLIRRVIFRIVHILSFINVCGYFIMQKTEDSDENRFLGVISPVVHYVTMISVNFSGIMNYIFFREFRHHAKREIRKSWNFIIYSKIIITLIVYTPLLDRLVNTRLAYAIRVIAMIVIVIISSISRTLREISVMRRRGSELSIDVLSQLNSD